MASVGERRARSSVWASHPCVLWLNVVMVLEYYCKLLQGGISDVPAVEVARSLCGYPGNAPLWRRLAFLALRPVATYKATWQLPAGELWIPVTLTILGLQLLASVLLQPAAHRVYVRRVAGVLGLATAISGKVATLACLLARPAATTPLPSFLFIGMPTGGPVMVWLELTYGVRRACVCVCGGGGAAGIRGDAARPLMQTLQARLRHPSAIQSACGK